MGNIAAGLGEGFDDNLFDVPILLAVHSRA
jgi:hypothetical protein